jgi:DNA-binding MarR family transcriptional regulator
MPTELDNAALASDLRVVIGQLVRRLRSQYAFSISQGAVLGRLDREGPRGVSDLAAAERVRPQSMAQTVRELEAAGLVVRRPDPDDGRRLLVELTPPGLERLHGSRARREGWLSETFEREFTAAERETLREALVLLRRIADA